MAVVLVPNLACTNESKQAKAEVQANNTTLAVNTSGATSEADNSKSTSEVKVYNIKEVKKGEANKAVDFTFEQNGKTVSFAELTKGKVVFLNFWGTWCPPCRKEIPDIIQINKELKGKDFIVIGLASERNDGTDALAKVTEFAKKNGIDYNLFIANGTIAQAYGGIQFVPTTFIIDKDGSIVETINGMRTKEEFMKSINKVLK